MQKKNILLLIILSISATIIFTVSFYNYSLNINSLLISENAEYQLDTTYLNKPVVYIGVISRYPPNIIYRGYQPLLDYLTQETKYRFELKLSSDYDEAVNLLVTNKVSVAFLGSLVYINAHDKYGVVPILKPLNENFEPFGRSVLITGINSQISNINDLKNKKLALPSRQSFSAYWIIKKEFNRYGIKPEELVKIEYFPHHQSVIFQVAKGLFDAGVTREYLVNKTINKKVKIILFSDPIPTSPLVVSANYDKNLVAGVKKALLKINKSNREKITKGWDNEFIYGFREASDKDYNSIREINR
ncbi:MAG: PhnD/SsuA/transferrin family substrate-binding protein [bacterium]